MLSRSVSTRVPSRIEKQGADRHRRTLAAIAPRYHCAATVANRPAVYCATMSKFRGSPRYGHLHAGRRYRVAESFTDFDRTEHPAGEEWVFLGHNFVPYDDGHTFYIRSDDGREMSFRMQGYASEQGPVIDALDRYLVEVI